jgi:hypothetical protein
MPDRCPFDYAVVRVVPRVERGEFVNAGVIVYCSAERYLAARIELDERRVAALDPALDLAELRRWLDAIPRVCEGGPDAGPIGRLPQRARFDWLVAPRSTVVQTSPVHTGLLLDPDTALEHLMDRMVRTKTNHGGHGGTQKS